VAEYAVQRFARACLDIGIFARLQVLRPDAESINRGIEDSLFIDRASGKGWRRQMVDLLGHARLVNATTLARCRARE
jgi:hypothetical protein